MTKANTLMSTSARRSERPRAHATIANTSAAMRRERDGAECDEAQPPGAARRAPTPRAASSRARTSSGSRPRLRRRRSPPAALPRRPCRRRRADRRTRTPSPCAPAAAYSSAPRGIERARIDAELLAQRALGERLRLAARRSRPCAPRAGDARPGAHLAVAGHRDAPLLGALRDVAVEPREAHVPQRRRERVADERAIGLRTRLAPDERVPLALRRIVDRAAAAPPCDPIRGPSATPRFASAASAIAIGLRRGRSRAAARRRASGVNAIHAARPASPSTRQRALHDAACRSTLPRRATALRVAADGAARRAVHAPLRKRVRQLASTRPRACASRARRPAARAPAAITRPRCSPAPGASTRNSGIENSTRSNSACSRIVGRRPKRRKIERPQHRRQDELDQPRVRRKAGIVRVRGAEHERLQHERDGDARACAGRSARRSARRAQAGSPRNTHSSMNARLQRDRRSASARERADARMLGSVSCSEGCHQPSQRLVDEVEERDERELERHEEIAAGGAAEHRRASAPLRATTRATAADDAGTRAA